MSQSSEHHDTAGHEGFHPHVVSPRVLLTVFGILLVLTMLTVAVTKIDLGKLNVWIALIIAVAKAGVVGLYFMHLRYDRPFHGIILVVSLMFVALFIGIALMDSDAYQPNLQGKPAASEAMP
ncbi:MAG: cytochrome C oxidase subunit IV family protein [Phycisphaeraceae bacterium]